MFCRARMPLTIAACAVAMPVAAQAPAPTTPAFDGTYIGVSRTLEDFFYRNVVGGYARHCSTSSRPGALTIVGGVARTRYAGDAEGYVTPQGIVVIHARNGMRIDAQIDSQGTVTGRVTGGCSYQMVWQKEGK